jgi:hypothetical protein
MRDRYKMIIAVAVALVVVTACSGFRLSDGINQGRGKLILATNSCGMKIYRVEIDGEVFVVNNQGGVAQLIKRAE